MSSPNLNNLMLVGCIIGFLTVLFHEQSVQHTQLFFIVSIELSHKSASTVIGYKSVKDKPTATGYFSRDLVECS